MKDYHKTTIWGIIAVLFGIGFAYWLADLPITGGVLIKWGKVTKGYITNTYQEYDRGESGSGALYSYEYTYKVDKVTHKKKYNHLGELKRELMSLDAPYPIEVEYLPIYPAISRIKGNGAQSLTEWFFREFCLGIIIYLVCIAPGYQLIKSSRKKRN